MSKLKIDSRSNSSPPFEKTPRYLFFMLAFGLVFPMFLTWVYFSLGHNSPQFQKISYGIGKTIQFLFPIFFCLLFYRNYRNLFSLLFCSNLPKQSDFEGGHTKETEKPFSWQLCLEGIGFGFLIFSGMIIIFLLTRNLPSFAEGYTQLEQDLGNRFGSLGLRKPVPYIMLGLFYSLIHSGLEEYYWRWFLYGQLRHVARVILAAAISSCGFTLHHIIVLGSYFGMTHFLTWLCSFGVFVGGLYWCWLYQRSGNVMGIWLGHGLIDASIFVVGYLVLF